MFAWMENLFVQQAMGFIRHFLTVVAGGMVAHGYATSDQAQQIVGGSMAVLAVGWSAYQKYSATQTEIHKAGVAALAYRASTVNPNP